MRPPNATGDSFFVWDGDTLVVNILGKPSAKTDAIGKPKGTQLKISVTASPEGGRATDHMLRFLAPLFGVPVSQIEVVFGQTNVNKQLRIKAPAKLPPVFNGPLGRLNFQPPRASDNATCLPMTGPCPP
jgi:uncharacterized protein (TIGR00251 family)